MQLVPRVRALALPAVILAAACLAPLGNVAARGAAPTATDWPPRENPEKLERLRLQNEKVELQKRKPLDGLTEAQLFVELDEALSAARQSAALWKINVEGSLQAADRLDERAARVRAGETRERLPQDASTLEYYAQEIRFRHTGDRKYRVRALLIVTNPADETFGSTPSSARTREIVRQGIVEARANLVALMKKNWVRDTERDIEITRRAIMFLDIWEKAKTAEETFVRAVEQNDYFPLKPCGVDQLIALDQVSDSTRQRVRDALKSRVEAALERVKLDQKSAVFGVPSATGRTATDEDFTLMCSLYAFWLKHSKEELNAARESRLFLSAPCGSHYGEGDRVNSDDRCP